MKTTFDIRSQTLKNPSEQKHDTGPLKNERSVIINKRCSFGRPAESRFGLVGKACGIQVLLRRGEGREKEPESSKEYGREIIERGNQILHNLFSKNKRRSNQNKRFGANGHAQMDNTLLAKKRLRKVSSSVKCECLYLQRLMRAGFETHTTCDRSLSIIVRRRPPLPEATNARTTWLSNHTTRALVEIAINGTGDSSRQTRHRRDSAAVPTTIIAEQRAKPTRGAARRRGDSGVALTDISVGCTCSQAWSLRVQGLHVRHRLFHAEGSSELGLRI